MVLIGHFAPTQQLVCSRLHYRRVPTGFGLGESGAKERNYLGPNWSVVSRYPPIEHVAPLGG